MVISRLVGTSLRPLPAVHGTASAASIVLAQVGCSTQRSSPHPPAARRDCPATVTAAARGQKSARGFYRPVGHSLKRFKASTVPQAQAASADSGSPEDSQQQSSSNKAGVLSALQGIKAENTLVIAVFLKILLLGSSGSIAAASLAQSGYGHAVGALQGLSLIPAAIGIFLLTRYILQRQLHLRKGFAWGIFMGGVLLLALSNRYSAMQRKYAAVPAPPVAQVAPQESREQYSRHRSLPTAEDSDRAFQAHLGENADQEWAWRSKND